jgi:histone deacetylase 1/2
LTAVYIINRLPTPVLQNYSPYEKVHNHKPDYHFLRAFGCACWPYLHPYNRHNWIFDQNAAYLLGIVLVIKATNV